MFGLDDDFSLPISHRATDALDTSETEVASVDKALSADNKGYQLLLRMGWTGKGGLGRNEDGAHHGHAITYSSTTCLTRTVRLLNMSRHCESIKTLKSSRLLVLAYK
jgi:hypothetical protein